MDPPRCRRLPCHGPANAPFWPPYGCIRPSGVMPAAAEAMVGLDMGENPSRITGPRPRSIGVAPATQANHARQRLDLLLGSLLDQTADGATLGASGPWRTMVGGPGHRWFGCSA